MRRATRRFATRTWVARVTCCTLLRVAAARTFHRPAWLTLPAVREERTLRAGAYPVERLVTRWVNHLIVWTTGRCVYRAYALASVLRRCGIPLVVNFGYEALTEPQARSAHCWLTWNDGLFAEPPTTHSRFPVLLGNDGTEVRYYVGDE